jgi:hypothetical protein
LLAISFYNVCFRLSTAKTALRPQGPFPNGRAALLIGSLVSLSRLLAQEWPSLSNCQLLERR